jgi:SAM-dependent methyltransferase
VLDVGCGPGRHIAALVGAGQIALGISVSAAAVMAARRRGAPARRVSILAPVPGAGWWMTALLLDGNIFAQPGS